MAESRENILITGDSIDEMKRSLNFAMQRISDRMDQIEGVRGGSTIRSDLNLTGNNIVNAGNFDQNLGTDDNPQFGGLTIEGDLDVTSDLTSDTLDANTITVTDSNSTVIHELS